MPRITIDITEDEVAALSSATWLAQTSAPGGTTGTELAALLRKVAPGDPALLLLAKLDRAAARTTAELLAPHRRDIDAELAYRRAHAEVVAGGSP